MQARVTRTRTTSLLFECVGVWFLPSCSAAAAREPWHARDMQVRRCSVRPIHQALGERLVGTVWYGAPIGVLAVVG